MATKFVGGSYLSDPAVLGNVACWYKFWDPTTLEITAGGGGGNPANGDLIGRALDQSGNGLHIDAPSAAGRPTFQTNINGTAGAALFNGTSQWLQRLTTSNVTANRSAFTIVAAVKHAAAPTGREPYALFSTGAGAITRIEHNASGASPNKVGGAVRRANADTLVGLAGTTDLDTGIHYVSLRVDYAADTMDVFLDGSVEASGVPPGTSGANTQNANGRIYIGGQGSAFVNGHIFEVLCLHAAPTDDEMRILWNYMRAQSQIG